jgi:hypothetical protein
LASRANLSNITENSGARGYIHSVADTDPIAPTPYSSKMYINDPNDVNGNNKSLKIDTDNQTIENYPIDAIGPALTKVL